jgi:hypothetical protein
VHRRGQVDKPIRAARGAGAALQPAVEAGPRLEADRRAAQRPHLGGADVVRVRVIARPHQRRQPDAVSADGSDQRADLRD